VQAQGQHQEERKDGERVVYRERSVSSYARTFTLPLEVDQTEAGARLEHGVLTLTLPKRGARNAAQITVS
jgi:HSP20 family protein